MLNWPKQRAWGWYATLIRTPWFCLKVLRFKSGGELSNQKHKHRTEIWWFIRGQGKIEYRHCIEDAPPVYSYKTVWFNELFSVWKIKKGWWHKFTAFNKPVYAIELQYGTKVTEKDIERKDV